MDGTTKGEWRAFDGISGALGLRQNLGDDTVRYPAAAVIAALPVAVAAATGIPLYWARNIHNYFFVGLLMLIGLLIFAVHLALQGRFELPAPRLNMQLAMDVVLFIMVVMGCCVIPMFTNNGVPGTNATRSVLSALSLHSTISYCSVHSNITLDYVFSFLYAKGKLGVLLNIEQCIFQFFSRLR